MANAMKSGVGGGGGGVAFLLRQFETRIDAGGGVFDRPPAAKSILPGFVRGPRSLPTSQVPAEPKGGQSTTTTTMTTKQQPPTDVVVVALSSSSLTNPSSEQRSNPSMVSSVAVDKKTRTQSVEDEEEKDSKKTEEGGCGSSQPTKNADDKAREANDEERTLSSPAKIDSSALAPKDAVSTPKATHPPAIDSGEREGSGRRHTETDCPSAAGSGPQKLKQVARSMECLSSSAAATPTKDRDGCTRNEKASGHLPPSTAPATMSSSASVPQLNNAKTPHVGEKKPPPPPVPKKKNPKVSGSTADEGGDDAAAAGGSDGSGVTSPPRVHGESQTMPNLSQTKKSSRPTTLLPDASTGDDDDDDRCKSLPVSSGGGGGGGVRRGGDGGQQLLSIGVAQKNTLFPCNRHRSRGRIVSSSGETEMGRGGGGGDDDSPNSGDDDDDDDRFRPSPLLLSQRTSTLSPTDDQPTPESACDEAFDSESFLSETFDFLGSSNGAENEAKASPLNSWAETWRRTTNQSGTADAARVKQQSVNNARDKTNPPRYEPERGAINNKGKPLQPPEPNKMQIPRIASSSNCDEKSGERSETAPAATRFGVVLRPKPASSSSSSLVRRSSMASAADTSSLLSRESTSTLRESSIRPDSAIVRPTDSFILADDNRSSFGLIRKPSGVSTCSSTLPLLVLSSSQRTLSQTSAAAAGAGARASSASRFRNSVRDSRSVREVGSAGGVTSPSKDELLDSELSAIDRAFNFLEDSGA